MAEKKKLSNKALEPKAPKKAPAPKKTAKAIDWDSQPEMVVIIGCKDGSLKEGKEYPSTKGNAQLIVNKGWAKLK